MRKRRGEKGTWGMGESRQIGLTTSNSRGQLTGKEDKGAWE